MYLSTVTKLFYFVTDHHWQNVKKMKGYEYIHKAL